MLLLNTNIYLLLLKVLEISKTKDFPFNTDLNCDLCLTAFDSFSECQRGIKCFGHLRATYWYLSLYSNSGSNLFLIFLVTNVEGKCLSVACHCLICPPPAYPSSLMELFLRPQPSEQLSNSCYQKQTEILPLNVSELFLYALIFLCGMASISGKQ